MTNISSEVLEGLLPCPFCGARAKAIFSYEAGRWDVWEVECEPCCYSIEGPHGFVDVASRQAAIAAWNTRAPSPEVIALRAEIARKDDGLEQIQLLASNHGGWLENDPAKLVSDIHKLAGTALNNGEEPLGDKEQGI